MVLPDPGRPDENDVVTAGGRHLQGALGLVLALDVLEIDSVAAALRQQLLAVDDQRDPGFPAVEQLDDVRQRPRGVSPHAVHDGRLARIRFRNDQVADAPLPRHHRHRERPFDRTDRSIQRKLTQEQILREILRRGRSPRHPGCRPPSAGQRPIPPSSHPPGRG